MNGTQKALILGGATGLLGQALVRVLKGLGWETHCAGRAEVDASDTHAGDKLAALMDRLEPSLVFNTIAYTRVDDAEEDAENAALLNRVFPAALGRVMKSRPGSALVHYSTDFVFNGKKQEPYTTEDAPAPLNVYGATKRAGEEALLALALPRCLIIRTAWLFGPGRRNFISAILARCGEQKELHIVHDQVGSPTYTLDLAEHSVKLASSGAHGLFHITNSGQASWCELASEAVRLAGLECTVNAIPSQAYPKKAVRPAYSVLDCASLQRATGITPRPWPQALQEYIFTDFLPDDGSA